MIPATSQGVLSRRRGIRSVGRLVVKLLTLGGYFSEALALEREPVSVVNQAIENGIGKGRIADDLVPMFDRKLAGPHGRAAAVPILHDFQEVAALLGGHWSKSPIIEDEKLDASQALEEPRVMAVAACQRERIEESRQALIENRAVIPTGLVAERACNPTLADAGRADDEQVVVPLDPLAGDELLEQRLVESARRLHVDILDDGVLSEACEAQSADQPFVVALGGFAVDEQSQPLLEGQGRDVRLSLLFVERLRHAGEPERDEAAVGGMCQHRLSFLS